MTGVPQNRAGGSRLAIVAPGFNAVSETFIADHARHLAPGATVLICQDSIGSETYGYPVLSHLAPQPVIFGRADGVVKRGIARVRRRLGPPLCYDDRMRLMEFLRAQNVTCVLAEYGPMGVLAGDVCARLGLPLYVIFHGMDASALLRRPRVVRQYRRLFRNVDGVIAVSQFLADNLAAIGAPRDRSHVVPCGTDVASFGPGTPEAGRVLALGRLTEKKAPHLTIRAFGQIAARFPQAHLDVVGDGPLRGACEQEIAALGLETRVTLHGALARDACRAFLARASVFVQHSVTPPNGDTEGSPVAIVEAMASCLPVVATRHSGIVDQVVPGETGYLVNERDTDAMAEAMATLLVDPAAAARMGAAGRERAERVFDQAAQFARLRQIIGLAQ